ncbi:hypothetical protein DPM19_22145 [Actinomadura craniellae]|uniref:Uncharacterized protein n=1 Tax=Actinomadura craniellae TaxID=2231787 RepID=A0A365H4P2_9ACTN|nr:IucA/IucC family C-terminal-domain containing protein [Actinomadura craniellae]RAY13193.1 hypothetical protein DPM19_22145 [Actinomadura craniellae]
MAAPTGEELLPEPLSALLDAAAGVPAGLRAGAEPGWRPADRLPELIEAEARRWDAPPHVAAALLWKSYSYWAVLPVTLGWALGRRVPLGGPPMLLPLDDEPHLLVGPRDLTVAVTATDPVAGRPGTVVAADETALLAMVRRTLLEDHLAPLIRALHARTRVGERTLWGSVAEAFAYPLAAHAESLPEPAETVVPALLDGLGPPVAGLVRPLPGPPGLRRRTCCLWVTLPGAEACPTCCLIREPGER